MRFVNINGYRQCSNVFKVWWYMEWSFCGRFCAKTNSERIL